MSYYRRRLSPIKPEEDIDYKDVDFCASLLPSEVRYCHVGLQGLQPSNKEI